MFALVDCNNFFVSCERVFKPKLHNQPVVVLSNNDGCVIARSNEAKALNIPMGVPVFKVKDIIAQHNVQMFSSNFELYGDMSARVMQILYENCPKMEIYSIDEAFLDLSSIKNVEEFIIDLQNKVFKWTGLPISIGVGPTKVLAKTANYFAKKHVCNYLYIINGDNIDECLAKFPVGEVWGVGRRLAERLKAFNIHTALDLANMDNKFIRKIHNVILERLHLELNGIQCLKVDDVEEPNKKSIASTRSFGKALENIADIEEAISNYIATASLKLRKQKSLARAMQIYIRTNRFKVNHSYMSKTIIFSDPTDDTSFMITSAKKALKELFVAGLKYNKAGILLFDFIPKSEVQISLISEHKPNEKLMAVMDKVNSNMKKKVLFFAAQGIKREWQMKSGKRSNRYTTEWNELLEVK